MMFERRPDNGPAFEIPEEVVSEVIALNDKATSASNAMYGREQTVTALCGLQEELGRLPEVVWPEPEVLAARVGQVLRDKAARSYANELRASSTLNNVFPEGDQSVHPELVDDSLQVMRQRRFERLGGTAGSYGSIRQEAKRSAAEQLSRSAESYQGPIIAQADITRCYREEVIAGTMTAIQSYASLLAEQIKPRHRTFAQFITNQAVRYEESASNGIVNANRQARRLTERLRHLNDRPEDYLAEQIIAYMSENRDYVLVGKNRAQSDILRILASVVRQLDVSLEEAISDGDSTAPEPTVSSDNDMFERDATAGALLKPVVVQKDAGVRHENHTGYETFSNIGEVELAAKWLPEGFKADLYEYHDGYGNNLLAVQALNDKAAAVYEASHFTRSDEADLEKRWLKVLGKVLAARDSAGRTGFRGFRMKQGEIEQE